MALSLSSAGEPIADINTTPLIDVMLVLLVMLILVLPPATNTLDYDLPGGDTQGPPPDRVKNLVAISPSDRIAWNGQPVTEDQLAGALARATALVPEPQLLLAPDAEASYDKSAGVLRLIKLSGATNVGFVGNERYRAFGKGGPAD